MIGVTQICLKPGCNNPVEHYTTLEPGDWVCGKCDDIAPTEALYCGCGPCSNLAGQDIELCARCFDYGCKAGNDDCEFIAANYDGPSDDGYDGVDFRETFDRDAIHARRVK